MKYFVIALILLSVFALNAQKKMILETKKGEPFKAWVNGKSMKDM